jgi:hypothetical protein
MHIDRSSFGFACRVAAFSFLMAGTASLMQAQQPASVASTAQAPLFLAAATSPAGTAASPSLGSYSSSATSSSSLDGAASSDDRFDLSSAALGSSQPPPRRRYGRPNYSGGNTNADGSEKYTFMAGAGASAAIGDTHRYDTESYAFQVGGGRNWNKNFGVLLQFDYDKFGLQGATLANQNYLYDYGCPSGSVAAGACGVSGLDGNSHIWSFTLNPTFTLPTEGSMGAYAVVGGGYYHKVTNFTEPTVEEECYYYCGEVQVNSNVDHYTSNAVGVNGGFGLTYKFSHFSNERFYVEARYVLILNSQRYGITSQSSATTLNNYAGYDFYPANSNRTTYIPITVGLRF